MALSLMVESDEKLRSGTGSKRDTTLYPKGGSEDRKAWIAAWRVVGHHAWRLLDMGHLRAAARLAQVPRSHPRLQPKSALYGSASSVSFLKLKQIPLHPSGYTQSCPCASASLYTESGRRVKQYANAVTLPQALAAVGASLPALLAASADAAREGVPSAGAVLSGATVLYGFQPTLSKCCNILWLNVIPLTVTISAGTFQS